MKKNVILLVLIAIFFSCSIVCATEIEDLRKKKDALSNQVTETNEEISNIQVEITENIEQLDQLNQKISEYESEIIKLEEDLNTTEKDIEMVTEKLNNIKLDYNVQKHVLEKRLVALYEAGKTQYLDVLLSSTSISEFLTNYYLISEIASYDNELLENIEREKNSIETIQETLNYKKDSLSIIKSNKEKTAIALENSKVIRDSYIVELTEKEKETETKLEEFQTDLTNIENQIVAATTGKVGENYVGGELAWPAPGFTTITSPFGMRLHPIFKVNRMHTGLDIGMTTGSDIIAANDGVVTKALYSDSYGNMVMIDHGGGVSTVYGHGSEIIVETGQTVKRGEVIMLAGSTGWSTGPHLHFEVRINGEYVDPYPYITHESSLDGEITETGNNVNNNEVGNNKTNTNISE